MIRYFCFFALCALCLHACLTADSSFTRVAPGTWRGVLVLDKYRVPVRDKDTVFVLHDAFKEGELPFNFEVKYLDNERFYIEIANGSERIRCDSIVYGRDRSRARDTMNIHFPEYQSYLHVEIRGNAMQGEWVVTTKENYRIPFYALAGVAHRFTPLTQAPQADLSGEWAVLFGTETDKPYKAIGAFKQMGNHLEGTFRTETGDYRFLEGTVQGRKFHLSCFDGSHAYLFSGSIRQDSLNGEFRSGKTGRALFLAWRDPNFKLGDADALTSLKSGAAPISFAFDNAEGKPIRFPGPAYEGKVKIFTLMGTWCPNCRDEQVFLVDFLKKNPSLAPQIAITAFAFERNNTPEQANAHLRAYKQKMGIPFDIVFAGKADKSEAAKVFPALSEVLAFPTMIVLDKQNKVRRIHTGFDGPATSKYEDFKTTFSALMTEMVKE